MFCFAAMRYFCWRFFGLLFKQQKNGSNNNTQESLLCPSLFLMVMPVKSFEVSSYELHSNWWVPSGQYRPLLDVRRCYNLACRACRGVHRWAWAECKPLQPVTSDICSSMYRLTSSRVWDFEGGSRVEQYSLQVNLATFFTEFCNHAFPNGRVEKIRTNDRFRQIWMSFCE